MSSASIPTSSRIRLLTAHPWARIVAWTVGILLLVVAVLLVVIWRNWPYRYGKVQPLLEKVLASQIEIQHYQLAYFPRPGFQAYGITLHRHSTDAKLPPIGTAKELIVRGGWIDLLTFRKHVEAVDIEGLHVVLPPAGSKQRAEDFPKGSTSDFAGPTTTVGELSIRDGVFEIKSSDGTAPQVFPVRKFIVRDLVQHHAVRYTVDMITPQPNGHLLAQGSFGPLNVNNLGDSPFSGTFTYEQAQLKTVGSLRGELSGKGDFHGTLASLAIKGSTDTPQFAVADGRPTPLKADVDATVNALNGDIVLNSVEARLGSSPLRAHGAISGSPKRTAVDIDALHSRAQDLMRPFNHDRPPITGAVSLRLHAQILPQSRKGEDFLSRLHVEASLDAPTERLTDHTTEEKLSAFSERAQGAKDKGAPGDPPDAEVLTGLSGPLSLRNGIVTSERLHVVMAGASADLHGSYSFRDKGAHLTGNLTMQADISHTATGWKAKLLKPLAPFFKHKSKDADQPAVTVIPIAITGKPGSYKVSGNLLHTK